MKTTVYFQRIVCPSLVSTLGYALLEPCAAGITLQLSALHDRLDALNEWLASAGHWYLTVRAFLASLAGPRLTPERDTVSLDRHPFPAYHTHHDNLTLVKADRLEEVVELLVAVVGALDNDYIPKPRNRVPVYLTRFDLYADWTHQRQRYDVNVLPQESIWSGLSVLDIALRHDLELELVQSHLEAFAKHDLLDKDPVIPRYTWDVRFMPNFA